jgi:hypothetical protein
MNETLRWQYMVYLANHGVEPRTLPPFVTKTRLLLELDAGDGTLIKVKCRKQY